MKKKNGNIIEIEPGSAGFTTVNNRQFLAALNKWAERKGVPWPESFRVSSAKWFSSRPKKRGPEVEPSEEELAAIEAEGV